MYENEDDYDFNPSDSSKLSTLFGPSLFQNEEITNNLMYTAPKQPSTAKTPQNPEKQLNATKVILLKVVSLWKSEDKTYKPMGKHGLAIIGATDIKTYEIIAYKQKTNTLLRARVSKQFYFHQRKDNFSSFYDNASQNWLVKFDTTEQQVEFGALLKIFGASIILEASEESKDDRKPIKPDILPKPEVSTNDQDSDSSDSLKKANILQRITKMGQQVVPKPLSVVESDLSEEYEHSENKNKKLRKIKKLEREEESVQLADTPSTHMVSRSVMSIPHVPVYYTQPTYGDINSVLIAQNSELKSSLNVIVEKLDTLNFQKKENNDSLSSKLKVLELKSENLSTELKKYKQKYSHLEVKYNMKCKTEDIAESERSAEVSSLKTKVAELTSQLEAVNVNNSKLEELEVELNKNKKEIDEYQKVIETQRLSLEELHLFYQQYKNMDFQSNLDDLQEKVTNLNETVEEYEMRCNTLESEKREILERSKEKANDLTESVKVHMNDMYQSLLTTLTKSNSQTESEVQIMLAKHLKDTSFQIISDIKRKLQD